MSEGKHTPGPWAWFGNAGSNSVYLATIHGGRRFVMDFTRWGMRGAQPRFQTERGIMVDAKDLLQFEVGDQSIVGADAARKDTSVYRLDVRGIASADAQLIAAAPDLLDALKDLLASNDAVHLILCDGPEVPGFDPTALGKAQLAVTAAEEVARAAISKAKGINPDE